MEADRTEELEVPKEPVKLSVDVNIGDLVFHVADDPALSIPVLCSELAKLRGSDASGQHDHEIPPEVCLYALWRACVLLPPQTKQSLGWLLC